MIRDLCIRMEEMVPACGMYPAERHSRQTLLVPWASLALKGERMVSKGLYRNEQLSSCSSSAHLTLTHAWCVTVSFSFVTCRTLALERKDFYLNSSKGRKAVLIFKLDWDGYLLLWFVNLWVTWLVVRILLFFHTIFLYLLIFIRNVRIKLALLFQSIGCNSEKLIKQIK